MNLRSTLMLVCLFVQFLGGAAALAAAEDVTVQCPQCTGEGTVACKARCKEGKARCPKTCLKLDDPGWVPGPEGKTVRYFPSHKKGTKGSAWWSTGHIGELIVYEDGLARNKGKCPTCGGTTLVDCKPCGGTGRSQCGLCKGAKSVNKADADAYAVKQAEKRKGNEVRLKDGRVLLGKVLTRTPDKVIIKTQDGKLETVSPDDIIADESAPKSEASGP